MITPTELMELAIDKARSGMAAGQSPFGCAIAIEDDVVAVAHNKVWATWDITAHAEIAAVRQGCTRLRKIFLEGAMVATTCEPCPMCLAALHWARVESVHYGATIADASAAGFNEMSLPAAEIVRLSNSPVKLTGGLLARECRALFHDWKMSGGRAY